MTEFPRKIRRATIRRKQYIIKWKNIPMVDYREKSGKINKYKIFGLVDNPKERKRELTINTNQKSKELLNTILHEVGGHVWYWNRSEKLTTIFADELTEILWKVGFRLKR